MFGIICLKWNEIHIKSCCGYISLRSVKYFLTQMCWGAVQVILVSNFKVNLGQSFLPEVSITDKWTLKWWSESYLMKTSAEADLGLL